MLFCHKFAACLHKACFPECTCMFLCCPNQKKGNSVRQFQREERRDRRPVILAGGAQLSQCALDPGKEAFLVDFKHTAQLCHLSDAEPLRARRNPSWTSLRTVPALFSGSVRCPIAEKRLLSASGPERRISPDSMYFLPLALYLVLSCPAWRHPLN